MIRFARRPLSGKEVLEEHWNLLNPAKANQDRRDREQVVKKAQERVNSSANKLGIASLAINNRISSNREVEKVEWAVPDLPNTPISDFLKAEENRIFLKRLEAALQSTQLVLSLLWAAREKDDKEEFANLLKIDIEENDLDDAEMMENEDSELASKLGDITPPIPILQMGLDDITTYFAKLIKKLLQLEGGGRLWAGKDKPAGKIQIYDEVAESILPRDSYKGRGTGGEGIANKLRIVTCYLLSKIKKDHNSFYKTRKPDFKEVHLDFENIEHINAKKGRGPNKKPEPIKLSVSKDRTVEDAPDKTKEKVKKTCCD